MSVLKFKKINSIPQSLESNTVYLEDNVQSGKLVIHVSNSTGTAMASSLKAEDISSGGGSNEPTILGTKNVVKGKTYQFIITNYDHNTTYLITDIVGDITGGDGLLSYTAPAVIGSGGFTINGKVITLNVTDEIIDKPVITSPLNLSTNRPNFVIVKTSPFVYGESVSTHLSTDWEIALDNTFTTPYDASSDDTFNLTQWIMPGLSTNTTYYLRARYKALNNVVSEWSNTVSFTTKAEFSPTNFVGILTPLDAQDEMWYGERMSMSADGSRLLIGAEGATINAVSLSGAAYLYKKVNGYWTLEHKFVSPTPVSNGYFGWDVCITSNGTRLAIGATDEFDLGDAYKSGKTYIYDLVNDSWVLSATLKPSNALSDNENSAAYLSFNEIGTVLSVSSANGFAGGGGVKIYSLINNVWSQSGFINHSLDHNETANGSSAVTINNSGDLIVLAAKITSSNAVYIYRLLNGVWTSEKRILDDTPTSGSYTITCRFSSDSSRVFIGFHQSTVSGTGYAGKISVYEQSLGDWVKIQDIVSNEIASYGYFGSDFLISADNAKLASVQANIGTVKLYNLVNGSYVYSEQISTINADDWWCRIASDMGLNEIVMAFPYNGVTGLVEIYN